MRHTKSGVGGLEGFQAFETEARRVVLQITGQAVAGRLNAETMETTRDWACRAP